KTARGREPDGTTATASPANIGRKFLQPRPRCAGWPRRTMRTFRIVVAAHGELADAFVSAATLICGVLRDLRAVGLRPDDSPEAFGHGLPGALAGRRALV